VSDQQPAHGVAPVSDRRPGLGLVLGRGEVTRDGERLRFVLPVAFRETLGSELIAGPSVDGMEVHLFPASPFEAAARVLARGGAGQPFEEFVGATHTHVRLLSNGRLDLPSELGTGLGSRCVIVGRLYYAALVPRDWLDALDTHVREGSLPQAWAADLHAALSDAFMAELRALADPH